MRNLAFMCCLSLMSTLAMAEIRIGLYRGVDSNGAPCTMEVRSRTELPVAVVLAGEESSKPAAIRDVYGVMVTGMPWAEILDIAALKMEDGSEKINDKDYAGYRGDLHSEAELVRLALDEKLNPTAFIYFNNVDVANKSKPIMVQCKNLQFDPNPKPEDVTVIDLNP